MLSSLGNLPVDSSVSLYLFVVNGGYEGGYFELVERNFERLAENIGPDAVIAKGFNQDLFTEEVLTKYLGANYNALLTLLPAILLTGSHPDEVDDNTLRLLIPLKDADGRFGGIEKFFSRLAHFARTKDPSFLEMFEDDGDFVQSINTIRSRKQRQVPFGISINRNRTRPSFAPVHSQAVTVSKVAMAPEKIKILFVSANPKGTVRLKLDEEVREITEKIRDAKHRDSFELITKWAARPDDLLQSLNEHKPHIVHFSGHGSPKEEIILLDNSRKAKPVSKEALISLFRTLKDNVRAVVLNACFSRPQAKAITQEIDCAIGMQRAIGDDAAIVFAASFYRAIGFGRSVQDAFDQGKTSLLLEGIPENRTPVLLTRRGVSAASILLITDSTAKSQGMSSENAASVIEATGAAVDVLDKMVSQIMALDQKRTEKQVDAGEDRWRHKIKRMDNKLIVTQDGQQIQAITTADLSKLPPEALGLIRTYEDAMDRNFQLWQKVYKKRDASSDALVNAQTDEQLKELVRKMKRDLTGIIDFLERLGLRLDDHYMNVRYLVEHV